MKSFFFAN